MIKYKRGILTLFILLAFVASLIILWERIRDERSNRTVELSLDYDSLFEMCQKERIPINDTLLKLKDVGITSISFAEMNLEQLQNQRRIRWMTGGQLIDLVSFSGIYKPGEKTDYDPSAIYILNFSPELGKTILRNVQLLMGKEFIRELNINLSGRHNPYVAQWNYSLETSINIPALEIKGNIRDLPIKGLGFDPTKIEEVRKMGFQIDLRPENRDIEANTIKTYLGELAQIQGVSCIIFGGANEILGFPNPKNLDATVEAFRNARFSFGDIEVPNERLQQKGATYLSQRILDRVVRVQSITPQYLDKMTPDDAIDIFRLGVRERNIRLIYLRPYPRSMEGKSLLETNLDYFAGLKSEIEKYGFQTGKASHFPIRNPHPVFIILISLGCAGALLLLLDQFYFDRGRIAIAVLILAILVPLCLIIVGKLSWAQKIIGIVLGVVFPIFALTSAFEEMEFIETKDSLFSVLGYSLKMFLKISLITILGGLILAALFSSTSYMLAVDRVKGIKAILFVPPVVCLIAYYLKGTNKRHSLKELINAPVYIWQVIVVCIVSAIGFILMLRSGNVDESLASSAERQLRVLMEEIFWVRPRFKDFALGHPSLIITMALSYLHVYAGLGIFVFFAGVGQADIIDTFCHVHTPIFISLVRVINGMILGTIIGSVAVTVYWYLRRKFKVGSSDLAS